MATPYYVPEESVPLPPPDAEVISTACDYCIVACGHKMGVGRVRRLGESPYKRQYRSMSFARRDIT